jgi:hypothetical protein
MVPVAYFRNRNDIIQALGACKKLRELYLHRYLEREQPKHMSKKVDNLDGERQHSLPSQLGDNSSGGEHDDTESDVETIPHHGRF